MKAVSSWAAAAAADLKAIYDILRDNHPGPVDDHNPAFKEWHEKGAGQALELAQAAKSAEGYYFSIRFYVAGFRDTHLNASSNLVLQAKWPGFVLAYRNGIFEPRTPAAYKSSVVQCDNVTPCELMLSNIFPYTGNPALEASWIEFTPWLLVDVRNPWVKRTKACVFETEGPPCRLRWRPIEMSSLKEIIQSVQFGPPPAFALREFADNCVWISVPTFKPARAADVASLKHIIESLPSLQRARLIVFDVRGNRGGNSQWGSDMIRALYGATYYRFRRQNLMRAGTYVEWRVSEKNEMYVQRRAQEIERDFGRSSPIVRMMRTVGQGMRRASRKGQTLYAYHESGSAVSPARPAVNRVKARIFLLTDGRCGSSCLDFADELFAMTDVSHVGQSTNADSGYAEVRSEVLPSGISRLTFAMKVYRNHIRKANAPYIVQHRWSGEISDTAGLESWVLKLAH